MMIAWLAFAAGGTTVPARAEAQAAPERRVSIIYTGRSLGALGVLRDADERELLVEQAERRQLPVRMGMRLGWRAGHVTFFSPDADLDARDLAALLSGAVTLQPPQPLDALISNNAILLQPLDDRSDLLDLIQTNRRAPVDFPDLVRGTVWLQRGVIEGRPVLIVQEQQKPWPADPDAWTRGEVNRLEVGESGAYEIAVNLGQIGHRATILADARRRASERGAAALLVDLGSRDGDLGLERLDRARLDYHTIARLGYELVVPYELELALGADALSTLRQEIPQIRFLAANVKARSRPDLFVERELADIGGIRLGLVGLVDPELRSVLARSSLTEFEFEDFVRAAARETEALRRAGADAVVVLSNLHPRDNNFLAREVAGIDAIVADLHVRWSPETIDTAVDLAGRPRSRPGSPALVARSFANGLGVGALELSFGPPADHRPALTGVIHRLESVTDRVPADPALVRETRARAASAERPRGPVLLPGFDALADARPSLKTFDATAGYGRISKPMWEEFLARLIRLGARSEVAIIRKLPHFPPAVGELHEAEVRAWLWTEDAILTLDLSGADLKAIIAEDARNDLVLVGVDRRSGTVHGRRIQDATFYRIATTDQLFEGVRFRAFERARRIKRRVRVDDDGRLEATGAGNTIAVRDYVLGELARRRAAAANSGTNGNGTASMWMQELARLLDRDPPYEPLFTFSFDRPTVFASFNRAVNNGEYGSVPESRVLAPSSEVIGVSGRYVVSYERQRMGLDLGLNVAFSRNRVKSLRLQRTVSAELADDLKLDVTLRAKPRGDLAGSTQPFFRLVFDAEFTPTRHPLTGASNRHQRLARSLAGLARSHRAWPALEIGAAVERDLVRGNVQWGLEGSAQFRRRLGGLGRLTYRWDNSFRYYVPSAYDDESDLGLAYRTIHELVIPLVDELSLSVAADIFLFRGKVPATERLGASSIVRVGLTYDRLWKPRYQPFF